ncbi:MAG: class I SAM-dependent methyltransferase [Candidatus Rokubacteria bacterium]|nr:class I SAM-dependent methyltransferase [Candidatus Rokubacteria bacterium]
MRLSTLGARLFTLGRNLLKYRLLRDVSIRSDRFGREHMADLAARFARNNRVDGAYLEFGVWRGSTFAQFYHAFRRHGLRVPMHAFDSFAGLPAPGGVDALPGYEPFRAGQFGCSVDQFAREMRARRVPSTAYTVIPGFYDQTLTPELADRLGIRRAALVWIDCVLYESAKPVLDFLGPLLQDGTLLMFNDFYRFKGHPDLGERKALAEFLAQRPGVRVTDYARFSSVGQAFIVHTTRDAALLEVPAGV